MYRYPSFAEGDDGGTYAGTQIPLSVVWYNFYQRISELRVSILPKDNFLIRSPLMQSMGHTSMSLKPFWYLKFSHNYLKDLGIPQVMKSC